MAAEPPLRTPRAPAPGEPPLTVTVGRAALQLPILVYSARHGRCADARRADRDGRIAADFAPREPAAAA